MKVAPPAALACLIPLLLAFQLIASPPLVVARTVYLMGTRTTLTVRASGRDGALQQLEHMVRSLEQTETELSTWRSDSVLSALNRHPVGEGVVVSAPVCRPWPELTAWHRETRGAFDPAVGALIDVWGLRGAGRMPSPTQLLAARALTGWAHLDFDAVDCLVTRAVDVTVDAGAFGKGAALRRLQQDYGGADPWLVDLGGQVAVSDRSNAWPVAIAHPRRRGLAALEIRLAGGSLATSGGSERSHVVEGQVVGHILDPRSGRPVNRLGSVTVWHPDPLAADVLSTALYVLGPKAGLRYAETNGLAALFLTPTAASGIVGFATRSSQVFRQRFPTVENADIPSGF